MIVGISRLELRFPESRSLKDKRRSMKGIRERISQRFNVSISEIGHHDLLQLGALGVSHVTTSRGEAERVLNRIEAIVEGRGEGELVRSMRYFIDPEKDFWDGLL